MQGKILIVEDEPIVSLDLKEELEEFGCEVVGIAESAEEALAAAEACRPDMALMDIHIVGAMDGVQTAQMLLCGYDVPSVFLTSYSDEGTVLRASRQMPYGYLTKPFQSAELKATLQIALHKAAVDARTDAVRRRLETAVTGMRDALLLVTGEGAVQFMNTAAEELTGWNPANAMGKNWNEVLRLSDPQGRQMPDLAGTMDLPFRDEFGWKLNRSAAEALPVDLSFAAINNANGARTGFVVTVREAAGRLRCQAIDEMQQESACFNDAPMAMVQLDADGNIARVNKALVSESGIQSESLIGRTLTGLSLDPDPRIAKGLLHKLMNTDSVITAIRATIPN